MRITPELNSQLVCATKPRPKTDDEGSDFPVTLVAIIAGSAVGCILIVLCIVCVFRKRKELFSDSISYGGDAEAAETFRQQQMMDQRRKQSMRESAPAPAEPSYRQPAVIVDNNSSRTPQPAYAADSRMPQPAYADAGNNSQQPAW